MRKSGFGKSGASHRFAQLCIYDYERISKTYKGTRGGRWIWQDSL